MKPIAITLAALLLITPLAQAKGGSGSGKSYSSGTGSHRVRSHTTKNGTYVPPHRATNPNGSKRDNWSSQTNVNPYTGKSGTVDPNRPRNKF
jgi:hypothetical protein